MGATAVWCGLRVVRALRACCRVPRPAMVLAVGVVVALMSPVGAAQTRPTASLWVGGGVGGKLDDAPTASLGVRVQRVGVAFYASFDLEKFSDPSGGSGADPVIGREMESLRGFDLLYFTGVSRQLQAYTGGGYYFEKGCAQLSLSAGQRTCQAHYDKKHFTYTAGVHFSPGRIVIGYGYHTLKGHEIMVGLQF